MSKPGSLLRARRLTQWTGTVGRVKHDPPTWLGLQVRIYEHDDREGETMTVDHHPAGVYQRVTFGEYGYGRRNANDIDYWSRVGSGRRVGLNGILAPVNRLQQLEDRWHLNDMRPGCTHITVPAERMGDSTWCLDNLQCPLTGYRWGRTWLVEPLPQRVLDEITETAETLGLRKEVFTQCYV